MSRIRRLPEQEPCRWIRFGSGRASRSTAFLPGDPTPVTARGDPRGAFRGPGEASVDRTGYDSSCCQPLQGGASDLFTGTNIECLNLSLSSGQKGWPPYRHRGRFTRGFQPLNERGDFAWYGLGVFQEYLSPEGEKQINGRKNEEINLDKTSKISIYYKARFTILQKPPKSVPTSLTPIFPRRPEWSN
jgi:hypothetical protein